MLDPDTLLRSWSTLVLLGVLVVAAFAHGSLGFGFPIISTPIVAMMTDMKSAVILTLFPNIAVNLLSIIKGGNWRNSLGAYWPVAIYVLLGTVAGTHLLLVMDPAPLKLLLAAMIVVYLQQARFRKLDWSALKRSPRLCALLFGSIAGILAGSVNVTVPPLVIYFSALGLEFVPMTQILNLCFLVGKSTQAVTLGLSGELGFATLVNTAPLTLVSAGVLLYAMRMRASIDSALYQRILRKILWAMALVLLVQVAKNQIFP